MSRKLGSVQLSVLDSLKRHGGVWYDGCGWIWDNYSGTVRILESLVKRGLVTKEPMKHKVKYVLVED